jgi:hypothetical protein
VLFLLKRPELALKASEAGLAVLSSAQGDKDQDSSERELLALRDQVLVTSLHSEPSRVFDNPVSVSVR